MDASIVPSIGGKRQNDSEDDRKCLEGELFAVALEFHTSKLWRVANRGGHAAQISYRGA
jgi:hypothetical protein